MTTLADKIKLSEENRLLFQLYRKHSKSVSNRVIDLHNLLTSNGLKISGNGYKELNQEVAECLEVIKQDEVVIHYKERKKLLEERYLDFLNFQKDRKKLLEEMNKLEEKYSMKVWTVGTTYLKDIELNETAWSEDHNHFWKKD